ncbi:nucleotidyltransferase domain-containing protein [Novosphingobium nitrogenifigens]|uniref:nucleotidyltransferase domain-containing protein n=1 Tax=Novosphingobium nitrogenifigens TaxID=378548 RepID=UPI0003652F47|nr:nucleotidyltransferase domain-containing protein [Novosphingobium nitrogenifigens]
MNLVDLHAVDWRDPVVGFALFGSRARGDEDVESDYDILVWSKGPQPYTIRLGMHAMAVYPCDYLLQKADQGDLFASHLAHEAREIWDPHFLLKALRTRFSPKQSYGREIDLATQIGMFILQFHHRMPSVLINRRIAWVVRTILIAKAMEMGAPVFAPRELTSLLGAPEAAPLIVLKDDAEFRPDGLIGLDLFLSRWAAPWNEGAGTIEEFRTLFEVSKNDFGLQTIKSLRNGADATDYR